MPSTCASVTARVRAPYTRARRQYSHVPAAGHSVDEYLETIYFLAFPIGEYTPRGAGSPPLASRVAEMLHVSRASAGEMLKRLEAEGLIERGKKKEALLTASGRERAERVVRKHRIIERLLTDFMGYTGYEAHERADALGDTFNDEMVDADDDKLGHPQRCPHGWPVDPTWSRRRTPSSRRSRPPCRDTRDDRPPRRARRRPPALVLRPGPRAGHELLVRAPSRRRISSPSRSEGGERAISRRPPPGSSSDLS